MFKRNIGVFLALILLAGANFGCAKILESDLSSKLVQSIASQSANFRASTRIIITFEPADVALYKKLLPAQFDMPEHPLVQIHMIDQTDVGPWPLTPYKEACVNLRCSYQGEEGWHIIFLPVSTWVSKYAGRTMGYPKFLADKVTFEKMGDGWQSEIYHDKKSLLHVAYEPGGWEYEPAWSRNDWDMGGPVLNLMPPGEGPEVVRVGMSSEMPASTTVEKGMARIMVDPAEPWAGLIPAGKDLPAQFMNISEARSLDPEQKD